MFRQEDAELAVKNRDLVIIEVLCDSHRRERALCRCRICGGTVLYDYEEIANLYGSWDNADIIEHWYPVELLEPKLDEKPAERKWALIKGARSIYGHNLEDDEIFRYSYQED